MQRRGPPPKGHAARGRAIPVRAAGADGTLPSKEELRRFLRESGEALRGVEISRAFGLSADVVWKLSIRRSSSCSLSFFMGASSEYG